MQNILAATGDWSFLVHIAALITALGYFFRDQIFLRSLIILGSSTYIAYYYLVPDEPLWDPIMWSSVFVLVNLSVISRLVYDRVGVFKNAQERQLFRIFYEFSPGMFRKLMAISDVKETRSTTYLTTNGKHLNTLYYVIDGGIRVEKDDRHFDYMPGAFIGEVAYLTGVPASATVVIPEGSNYIEWDHQKLKKLASKNPELKMRLEAMLNQDMAHKVRFS